MTKGFAIVKVEADFTGGEELVSQFNSYMQLSHSAPSFLRGKDGYFRLAYDDSTSASSVGLLSFGNFLQTCGYKISGIESVCKEGGECGEKVDFSDGTGKQASVLVSTVNVY